MNSFLIAHVVRGQPAFDVACQIECAICQGISCDECEEGHWWIIPTSGHRAYPYWNHELFDLYSNPNQGSLNCREMIGTDEAPPNWPDHYAINNRALRSEPSTSLADRLGLNVRQPSTPIRRRV